MILISARLALKVSNYTSLQKGAGVRMLNGRLGIISKVNFCTESASGLRHSLSRQDFVILEGNDLKNRFLPLFKLYMGRTHFLGLFC